MESENKSDWLYRQLHQRVMRMRDQEAFPTVRQLMAEYGLSLVTVTAAVRRLKEKGLVESFVGRGSFVRRERQACFHVLMLQPNWESAYLDRNRDMLIEAVRQFPMELEVCRYDYRVDIFAHLNEYSADLIVLDAASIDRLRPEQVMMLTQSMAPVILCSNAVPLEGIRYVCGDNNAVGMLAVRHLTENGHDRLGFLYCEPHVLTSETVVGSFNFAASASGCKVTLLDCGMRSGDRPEAKIREFARRFADGEFDFTAMFAISDYGALVALREFEALGIEVPETLSILGCGNVKVPGIERLTTVDTPRSQIAQEVATMAYHILGHHEGFRTQVNVPPVMAVRKTVRQLPVRQVV